MSGWNAFERSLRRTTRLCKLAAHPRTSTAVLVRMAKVPHQHEGVLSALLRNSRLPKIIAKEVAQECLASLTHGWVIRQGIANSQLVSQDLLRQVARLGEWYIAIELVHNPNCPDDVLERHATFHSEDEEEMKKWKPVIEVPKKRLTTRRASP